MDHFIRPLKHSIRDRGKKDIRVKNRGVVVLASSDIFGFLSRLNLILPILKKN